MKRSSTKRVCRRATPPRPRRFATRAPRSTVPELSELRRNWRERAVSLTLRPELVAGLAVHGPQVAPEAKALHAELLQRTRPDGATRRASTAGPSSGPCRGPSGRGEGGGAAGQRRHALAVPRRCRIGNAGARRAALLDRRTARRRGRAPRACPTPTRRRRRRGAGEGPCWSPRGQTVARRNSAGSSPRSRAPATGLRLSSASAGAGKTCALDAARGRRGRPPATR